MKAITPKYLILLAILTGFISLIKPNYLFILMLFPIIPKIKFISHKKKYVYLAILLFVAIFFRIFWNSIIPNVPETRIANLDPIKQASFVLLDPIGFIKIFTNTIIHGPIPITQMIIGVFGWLYYRLPDYIYIIFYIIFIPVSLFDITIDNTLFIRDRILSSMIFMIFIITLYIFFFITWNPVGAQLIDGVQGRYMLPILGVFSLSFTNLKFLSKPIISKTLVLSFVLISLSSSIMLLLNKFYHL